VPRDTIEHRIKVMGEPFVGMGSRVAGNVLKKAGLLLHIFVPLIVTPVVPLTTGNRVCRYQPKATAFVHLPATGLDTCSVIP
jgi:hypothetical protein